MACHQERRSATFLSSRKCNRTPPVKDQDSPSSKKRKDDRQIDRARLPSPEPRQKRRSPSPRRDRNDQRGRNIAPLLRPPWIVETTSLVDHYQGKLQKPHSLLAWRSHLRWEPTMEQWTPTSILRILILFSIIEESEGPSNADCS